MVLGNVLFRDLRGSLNINVVCSYPKLEVVLLGTIKVRASKGLDFNLKSLPRFCEGLT